MDRRRADERLFVDGNVQLRDEGGAGAAVIGVGVIGDVQRRRRG